MSRRGELGNTAREPVIGFVVGLFLTVVGLFVPLFAIERGGRHRETFSVLEMREHGLSGVWLLFAVTAVLVVIALVFPQRFGTTLIGTSTMALTFMLVIGELLMICFSFAMLIARVEANERSEYWSSGVHHVDLLPWLAIPIVGLALSVACLISWWSRTARSR